MVIWERRYLQAGDASGHTKNKIIDGETDIILISFITCISTSYDANKPQMGTR